MIPPRLICDKIPGAIAGFSTRKLLKTYSGNCLRLRRSSDNSETDIGFLPNGQIDIDSAKSFCGAGDGFVVKPYLQIGSVSSPEQTTAAWQPQLISNGNPYLFNDKYYLKFGFPFGFPWVTSAVLGLTTANSFTIYSEFISTISSNFDAILSNFSVANSGVNQISLWNTQGNVGCIGTSGNYSSTASYGFPTINIPRFAWMRYNASNYTVDYENSNGFAASISTANAPPNGSFDSLVTLFIGSQGNNNINTSNYLDGYLSKLIIWNRIIPRLNIRSKSLEVA